MSYVRKFGGRNEYTEVDEAGELSSPYLYADKAKVGDSVTPNAIKTLDVAGNMNFDIVNNPVAADLTNIILTESTGGTLAAGEYYYNFNFATVQGETSCLDSSSKSITVVNNNASVIISNIPISSDPRVTSRKIYRSTLGDANRIYYQYYFASVNDNTSTTYIDTGAAASINDYSYWKSNTTAGLFYIDSIQALQVSVYNTAFGISTLNNLTRGNANTAVGYSALNQVRAGSNNVGIGHSASSLLTAGSNNVGIGYAAGNGNQTGSHNVAIGANALRNDSNLSQGGNIAIGTNALGRMSTSNDYNIGIGYYAGNGSRSTGNIFIGYTAGYKVTPASTQSANIVIGYEAGMGLGSTAANNILIGRGTELPISGGTNQLNLGNAIYATNLGTSASTPSSTAKIGIRNNNPQATLDVSGTTILGGSGGYSYFEADGTYVAVSGATYWDDLIADVSGVKTTGAGVSVNTTENTLEFVTTANLSDYIYHNFQMAHKWLFGSKVYPHIHWEQVQANTPNWLIQYRWQRNGGTKTTDWTNYKCNTNVFTYLTGTTLNQLSTNNTGITPPLGYSISDIIQVRVLRDSTNASTVFAGADTYTVTASLTSVDIHIECDTLGSRTEYSK